MADHETELGGPDLVAEGAAPGDVPDGGMLLGHAEGEAVLLARAGSEVFALAATCAHYGGPLAEGVFDGSLVRCPWHHACFDVRTGVAARAPALDGVTTFGVEERGGRLFVTGAREVESTPAPIADPPASVLILGAGAAGNAAAEMLRREGYDGPITMVTQDDSVPYDRPNLSKDYLAGNAEPDWIPLRSEDFYEERDITLRLRRRATSLDPAVRVVRLDDGTELIYGALLIATGAEPIALDLPGVDQPHVHYLRTLSDSNAIIEGLEDTTSAVVIGAGFIGLEVAASLRAREIETHVVVPGALPMERILGRRLGEFVQAIHEEHGVQFHFERTVATIGESGVTLDDGSTIAAGLVVVGVGVRPEVGLAEAAGLELDNGILVDEQLRTSAEGIWAAGDVARWPDPHTGQPIRVEHWAVAERQGQAAARNILGRNQPFTDVPFFWSQHYDVPINYVGHARVWDRADESGNVLERDGIVALRQGARTLAVASIYRDFESLQAELALERDDEAALQGLVPPPS